MQSSPDAPPIRAATPKPHSTQSGKQLIEEFGDKIQVDSITYLECVIAFKRGVKIRWIRDVDNVSRRIILKDQDFDQ